MQILMMLAFLQFDYLKSSEIGEKINQVRWCVTPNDSLFILSANDRTIKLWKVCILSSDYRMHQHYHITIIIEALIDVFVVGFVSCTFFHSTLFEDLVLVTPQSVMSFLTPSFRYLFVFPFLFLEIATIDLIIWGLSLIFCMCAQTSSNDISWFSLYWSNP